MFANLFTIGTLLLFAAAVWYVFLRAVPRQAATGVITDKKFKAAGAYHQYRSENRPPARIPVAESYIFTIQVDGQPLAVAYSLNTTASEQFVVGQRVAIVYEWRGLPFIWSVARVVDMRPVPVPRDSATV
jgi:hypothetical protein